MQNHRIRIFIVEDSAVMRELLQGILSADPDISVVGTAANGADALEALSHGVPDLVTVDINMPGMNGFELTRRIIENQPVPIVIVTANWRPEEVATTFKAIEAGAVAIVGKPHGPGHRDHERDARYLVQTVKAMSEVKMVRRWSRPRAAVAPTRPTAVPARQFVPSPTQKTPHPEVVAIGASTGGPLALQTILRGLRPEFPAPILIVQHIAVGFLQGLVDWLAATTGFRVSIAGAGEQALPGHAYLAPDGFHMGVAVDRRLVLSLAAPDAGLRPSVAHLFESVSRVYGAFAAGVLLTGMGRDGAEQLKMMRDGGAMTIAQDRESSLVFGMPGEAVKLDAAAFVLSPERIAALLEAAADQKVHLKGGSL